MPRDIVRGAAMLLYGTATLYADLEDGDRFYFPTNDRREVCTKLGLGWYSMEDGRRFRTGVATAVVPAEG